jgi:secreted trypsin-like serine protease
VKRVGLILAAMLLAVILVAGVAQARDITIQVVGGDGVPDGKYEFVAAIMDGANPVTRTYCTGSLIDPNTVITAAHCAKGIPAAEMKVAVGKTNLADDSLGVIRQVSSKHIHPRYQDLCGGCFDVAVLNLESAVPYEPANIAPDSLDDPKTTAKVAGYGSVDPDGSVYKDRMQEANVTIRNDDFAKSHWESRYVKSIMISALGENGEDTCYGDSGGPLFKMVDGEAEVLGATSFGSARCGTNNKPGVYTELNAPAIEEFIVETSR